MRQKKKAMYLPNCLGAALVLAALAGCTQPDDIYASSPVDELFRDAPVVRDGGDTRAGTRRTRYSRYSDVYVKPRDLELLGEERAGRRQEGKRRAKITDADNGITLNFREAPVEEVVQAVLGDILGLNYVIAPDVQGRITVYTAEPISRQSLLKVLEIVLDQNGFQLTRKGQLYSISKKARSTAPVLGSNSDRIGGRRLVVVRLNYIKPAQVTKLIRSVGGEQAVAFADNARNLIVLSGTYVDIENYLELIRTFDIDVLKGLSFGIYPVRTKSPLALARQIERVVATRKNAALNNVQIVPNKGLNAILVIAKSSRDLRRIREIIKKLDQYASENEEQVYVYRIEYRPPKELAKLLTSILQGERSGEGESVISPRYEAKAVEEGKEDRNAEPAEDDMERPPSEQRTAGAGGIAVVPDEANKSLLIRATPADYERILNILYKIDVPPTQVMLDAVIAEVTLTDALRFGVKWFLRKKGHQISLSDLVTGSVSPVFPGFSYIFEGRNIKTVIDALSEVTDVNIVAAPSLMVMDNKQAILQIGDQVPIATQVVQDVETPKAPVVTKIDMKDTGVIFRVTPQINENGQIRLSIDQEISSARKTTTSGIDSPTISRRKISTSVIVEDGDVVALGGLIQQKDSTEKRQVPILGDIPLLGTAFRSKNSSIQRTELIVFLRPRILRNRNDMRAIAKEFRNRLSKRRLLSIGRGSPYKRDLMRIIK